MDERPLRLISTNPVDQLARTIEALLVVGGKGGYVERDGHLVDPDRDVARRQEFGADS